MPEEFASGAAHSLSWFFANSVLLDLSSFEMDACSFKRCSVVSHTSAAVAAGAGRILCRHFSGWVAVEPAGIRYHLSPVL